MMSRQIGSLNRSLSYPSKLQCHSPNISTSDLTPSPIPSYTKNSPRMGSDDNFSHIAFHTTSQFNNSDIETADEFQNSEPSASTFSQPISVHSTTQLPTNVPQPLLPTPTNPNSLPNDQRPTRPP